MHLTRFVPLLLCAACSHDAPPTASGEVRTPDPELADLARSMLGPAQLPPAGVDHGPHTLSKDGISLTVELLRPETQEWNRWPDGTARLFNDGYGYLFKVVVDSPEGTTWARNLTELAVNEEDVVFRAARSADDCLMMLMLAGEVARQDGYDPFEFGARYAAAMPFRMAYMDSGPLRSHAEGLIFFPAPAEGLAPVAMQLTLGWKVPLKGPVTTQLVLE